MPNKTFPLCKKSSKYLFFQRLTKRKISVLKIFQLCIYFQILTIYGVRAVFIFPLRLSPQYYIPGLVDPPPSKPYSINNALKFSHSSKSAQDITNEFLRRFSQVSRKPKPTKPSRPSKPRKPGKSPPSPYSSATEKAGINFALPLNYEISNPSTQKNGPRMDSIDEKLVLIVFKLPVRKSQDIGGKKQFSARIRIKRQRPSLQFYERQDAEAVEGAPSRTMSLGKKIRSWWEGGARTTSAFPKFRPTRPNRPFSGRPFTTTASSNKFFFGKFLKNGSTQRPRPSRSPPTRGKSSPSTTKGPFMTFSDYTFNSPGCHPRGPKLILCSTDRIEHLSMLLEKFMHYQERNNLSPYFIDTEEEDSDSYGSYDNYPPYRHYGYRQSGKVLGRARKPFGVAEPSNPAAGPHPSVVVLAMNNKETEENHEEEEPQSSSHSLEGYHHQDNKDQEEHKEGSEETKDSVEIHVGKGENDESTKQPRIKRNKRKLLRRRVQRRSKEEISSSSEEESFGGGKHREDPLTDRYLSTKREIEDERDAEYKRLKRLLKLIKRYQELI